MIITKMMHSDGGHGWLAVKTKELVELGIADKITSYSFVKGKTTYLEEDQDATTYVKAHEGTGQHCPDQRRQELGDMPSKVLQKV